MLYLLLQKASVFQHGGSAVPERSVSCSPFKMDPLLHILYFGRRWEVTLRLFLTRSKFILSTPSYCLKHMKSSQIKDFSLSAMCPDHWAEDSALLGSKPEFLFRGESPYPKLCG